MNPATTYVGPTRTGQGTVVTAAMPLLVVAAACSMCANVFTLNGVCWCSAIMLLQAMGGSPQGRQPPLRHNNAASVIFSHCPSSCRSSLIPASHQSEFNIAAVAAITTSLGLLAATPSVIIIVNAVAHYDECSCRCGCCWQQSEVTRHAAATTAEAPMGLCTHSEYTHSEPTSVQHHDYWESLLWLYMYAGWLYMYGGAFCWGQASLTGQHVMSCQLAVGFFLPALPCTM